MVYTVYKGVGLGIGVVAADFHNTAQTVKINMTHLRVVFNLNFQIESRAQQVKTCFVVLIESPYTTLYQTVRTCHDISSDEVA